MTKLKLQIAHQVPGRLRIKIPAGKDNPELLKQISETFGVIPGIEQITVNPTTGSIVLHYDADRHDEFHGMFQHHYDAHPQDHSPSTEIDVLTRRIEDEAELLAGHSHSARAVVDFVKKLDRGIKTATNNTIELKIAFAVGIIGFTVWEVGAMAATPVWVTLAIFTLNHFIELQQAPAAAKLAPIKIES
jgi:hypothetical protein